MKALTICQPYVELIARGDKRVENRIWATRYRGPLLIHAGKSRQWLNGDSDEELLQTYGRALEFGSIVCLSDLVDVLHIDDIEAGKYDEKYPWLGSHPHANGPWCWILESVRRLPNPIPFRGTQSIFDVPDDLIRPAA